MDNQTNQTPTFFAILAFMAAIFMIAGGIGGGLDFRSNWWLILLLIGIGIVLAFIARSSISEAVSSTNIVPSASSTASGLTVPGTTVAAQSAPAEPAETVEETSAEAEPEPAPEEEAPAPEPVAEETDSDQPDDLTLLEGIGPKMSQALIAQGYTSFSKLADASLDEIREALEAEGQRFAPSSESWAEQASYAAKGDMEGLEALQGRLIGGRYPDSE